MAKYIKKSPNIVEADQYDCGSEDGYSCYESDGSWLGWLDKESDDYENDLLKYRKKPFVYDHHGDPVEYDFGDYLVRFENKSPALGQTS